MLLENWKDIKVNKTVEQINRESLDENAVIPTIKNWSFGNGYTRPFNGIKSYSDNYSDSKVNFNSTDNYIKNLNLNESMDNLDESRLREGPGAGYKIIFKGLKVKNVKLTKKEEQKEYPGYYDFEFEADIIEGDYDWEAAGYDWFVSTEEGAGQAEISGKVHGTYSYWDRLDPDKADDWAKYDIASEEYDIGELYGGGYVHSNLPENYTLESIEGDNYHYSTDIDLSPTRSGYKCAYIDKAELKINADFLNSEIEYFRYGDEEDLEPITDDREEDQWHESKSKKITLKESDDISLKELCDMLSSAVEEWEIPSNRVHYFIRNFGKEALAACKLGDKKALEEVALKYSYLADACAPIYDAIMDYLNSNKSFNESKDKYVNNSIKSLKESASLKEDTHIYDYMTISNSLLKRIENFLDTMKSKVRHFSFATECMLRLVDKLKKQVVGEDKYALDYYKYHEFEKYFDAFRNYFKVERQIVKNTGVIDFYLRDIRSIMYSLASVADASRNIAFSESLNHRVVISCQDSSIIDSMFDVLPDILSDYDGDANYGYDGPNSFYVAFEKKDDAERFASNIDTSDGVTASLKESMIKESYGPRPVIWDKELYEYVKDCALASVEDYVSSNDISLSESEIDNVSEYVTNLFWENEDREEGKKAVMDALKNPYLFDANIPYAISQVVKNHSFEESKIEKFKPGDLVSIRADSSIIPGYKIIRKVPQEEIPGYFEKSLDDYWEVENLHGLFKGYRSIEWGQRILKEPKLKKDKLKVGNVVKYNGKSYIVKKIFDDGNSITIQGIGRAITLSPDKVEKIFDESSVSQRLDEPICYVLKNKETGEYASLDSNTNVEWVKNLGDAESFDNRDNAYDFLEDEVLPTMSLYRGEDEDELDYEERNLDYKDSLRDDTFIVEPVYRDSLNESKLKEGKYRLEHKNYPHGISKYTDYEDDQVKSSYYKLPYGFRSDRDDQEDWEKDLRYKAYLDYDKEASDWLDKNVDAWDDSYNSYTKSLKSYENKVESLKSEASNTEEYKNLEAELKKARKYKDYAQNHGWLNTVKKQNDKALEISEQIKKYVDDYVKNHLDISEPKEDETYSNDFKNIYDTHLSKMNSEIEDRKAKFISAAEGKKLFSGRDKDNKHHFYYKNGDKYKQIGSRGFVKHPFGVNRGLRDYYEAPDATQEFDDYSEEDISSLEPIKGWDSYVLTKSEDSTD